MKENFRCQILKKMPPHSVVVCQKFKAECIFLAKFSETGQKFSKYSPGFQGFAVEFFTGLLISQNFS